ncbi:hypothetical protein [Amycolatopsis taiwanensis]|uniref:hypothetical protein n=1 Tax=Amycolatopsis taiwanensis TaxID=342230 RepID=UPI0004AE0A4A|nr:hypothetical protein [Amycolatopsis taiwanensis]
MSRELAFPNRGLAFLVRELGGVSRELAFPNRELAFLVRELGGLGRELGGLKRGHAGLRRGHRFLGRGHVRGIGDDGGRRRRMEDWTAYAGLSRKG